VTAGVRERLPSPFAIDGVVVIDYAARVLAVPWNDTAADAAPVRLAPTGRREGLSYWDIQRRGRAAGSSSRRGTRSEPVFTSTHGAVHLTQD
jgi:hypothetical protein